MSDGRKNLFLTTVVTPPAPAQTDTHFSVADAALPTVPCNLTVVPPDATPTLANSEIVRVTANVSGTLTVIRAQEGTTAKDIDTGWLVFQAPTVKMFTDLEAYADAAVNAESLLRQAADTTLQTSISGEATARANADTALQTALQTNIDAEATARADADTTLQTNINTVSTALGVETTNRINAMTQEVLDRNAAINTAVANLINGAPGSLDALNELAAAMGNDPNFATTVTNALAGKQPLDTELTALSALTSAADRLPYFSGVGVASLATFTSFGRTVVGAADAAAGRTALALGDIATHAVAEFDAAGAATAAQTAAQTYADTNKLAKASNLSDLANFGTARANLGLGTTNVNGAVTHWSMSTAQTYTQTTPPVGVQGTPLMMTLNVASATDNAGGFGPQGNSGGTFGPRGTVNLEGTWQLGADQNTFSFTPIFSVDMLMVKNVVGANRAMVPGWGYISARLTVADTNTVTLRGNDIGNGAAAFVDSQTFLTTNAGTMNGVANPYELISFLSIPVANGNTHLTRRTAFKVLDMNYYLGTPGTDFSTIFGGLSADAGVGVVDTQVGVDIPRLTKATRNIGIQNGSATVKVPRSVTLTAATDTIPCDASVIALTGNAAYMLSATPTIAAGVEGQILEIINVGANLLSLQDAAQNALATNLFFGVGPGRKVVNLAQNQMMRFMYIGGVWTLMMPNDLGIESKDGAALHGNVTMFGSNFANFSLGTLQMFKANGDANAVIQLQQLNGVPTLSFGPGGATGADVTFTRSATAEGTMTGAIKLRRKMRVSTIASAANPAINSDTTDLFTITAQAAAITSMSSNLSGTPNDGDELKIAITDNGTARAITWGAKYEASTVALPTTTVTSARLDCEFIWNAATSKWRLQRVS